MDTDALALPLSGGFAGLAALAGIMGLALFGLMGFDKARAASGGRRVPEKTLWTFALAGGAWGGWLGMRVFRHKTRHWSFALGFPALTAAWAALLIYVRNR